MEENKTDSQPLFKGQATYSKEILKEFAAAAITQRRIMIILFFLLLEVSWGILIRNAFIIAVGVAVIILLVFLLFFQRYIIVKNIHAVVREESNGTDPTNFADIFENKIVVSNHSTGNKFEYPLSAAKNVTETKNLIIITTKAKINVLLEKSKFELGNKDTLIMFVKSKIAENRKN